MLGLRPERYAKGRASLEPLPTTAVTAGTTRPNSSQPSGSLKQGPSGLSPRMYRQFTAAWHLSERNAASALLANSANLAAAAASSTELGAGESTESSAG